MPQATGYPRPRRKGIAFKPFSGVPYTVGGQATIEFVIKFR
jgi:hypothetical protein